VAACKKKNKGHGHHGGAWKVAYADFVTAMMALFIVLWLLTQSDQASKEQIAEYFRTGTLPGGSLMVGKPGGSTPPRAINIFPDGQGQVNPATETREMQALKKNVEAALKLAAKNPEFASLAKHVKVKVVNEGALIEMVEGGDNFLFNVASSELKPGAIKILEELAPILSNIDNRIEIHGHTDARPFGTGSKKTNWELSFERGDQARRVLEGKGIEKGKIQSVLAHADTALYNPDEPLSPVNRRLAILVVKASAQRARAGLTTASRKDDDEEKTSKRSGDEDEEPSSKRRVEDDEDRPAKRSRDEDEGAPSKKTDKLEKPAPVEDEEPAPKRRRSRH